MIKLGAFVKAVKPATTGGILQRPLFYVDVLPFNQSEIGHRCSRYYFTASFPPPPLKMSPRESESITKYHVCKSTTSVYSVRNLTHIISDTYTEDTGRYHMRVYPRGSTTRDYPSFCPAQRVYAGA